MLDAIIALPPWALKSLALALGLATAFLAGLGISRLYRKLTDRRPLD